MSLKKTDPAAPQGGGAKKIKKGRAEIARRGEALGELTITYVSRLAVRPNAYNPNRQTEAEFEMLCRSMSDHGITQPIIVREETGIIVDGEHRWRAAGHVYGENCEIPVVYVPMSTEQAMIATFSHNRARGSEDIDLSQRVLKDLRELGALDWATEALGLSDDDVSRLLDERSAPEMLADADYTEAWEPAQDAETAQRYEATNDEVGNKYMIGVTPAAAKQMEAVEQLAQAATTDEERMNARLTLQIYRINLTFTGKQGALVRAILSPQPATKLIELCKSKAVELGIPVT